MKKLLTTLTITLILALSLTSCATSKAVSEESTADTYMDETSQKNDEVLISKSNSTQKSIEAKKSGNAFISFIKGKDKFAYGDTFKLYANGITNGLKETEATSTVLLKNGYSGFGSTYLAAYYYVFMDEKNRAVLETAYKSYLTDFENKKLVRNSNKTLKAYGKISVTLYWGTLKMSTPSNGIAKATLGYKFVKNSPYFVISVPATFNEYSKTVDTVAKESIPLTYSFTKAQAAELLQMLSDENIMKIVSDYQGIEETATEEETEVEGDSYDEAPDTTITVSEAADSEITVE